MFKLFCLNLCHFASFPLVFAASIKLPLFSPLLCFRFFSSISQISSHCCCPTFLCPSFYLTLFSSSGRNYHFYFSPFSIGYNWVRGHLFLPGKNRTDELARQVVLLQPSSVPCNLPSVIYRIHSLLFSGWERTVSSSFFDTLVPQYVLKKLWVLVSLVVSSLVFADAKFYLSKMDRIENSSCSACGYPTHALFIVFCIILLRNICSACF